MSESKRYLVAPVEEIPVGERKIVDLDGISVGVFNRSGFNSPKLASYLQF